MLGSRSKKEPFDVEFFFFLLDVSFEPLLFDVSPRTTTTFRFDASFVRRFFVEFEDDGDDDDDDDVSEIGARGGDLDTLRKKRIFASYALSIPLPRAQNRPIVLLKIQVLQLNFS